MITNKSKYLSLLYTLSLLYAFIIPIQLQAGDLENQFIEEIKEVTPSITKINSLIEKGIDIDYRDGYNFSLLDYTILFEKINIMKILLNHGVDVNAKRQNGGTALLMATEMGSFEIISLLVEYGADVNITDKIGLTPLMSAVNYGVVKNVDYLIENGADVKAQDAQGNTAFSHITYDELVKNEVLPTKEAIIGKWMLIKVTNDTENPQFGRFELDECDKQTVWNFSDEQDEPLQTGQESKKLIVQGVSPCKRRDFESKWTIVRNRLFISYTSIGESGGLSMTGPFKVKKLTSDSMNLELFDYVYSFKKYEYVKPGGSEEKDNHESNSMSDSFSRILENHNSTDSQTNKYMLRKAALAQYNKSKNLAKDTEMILVEGGTFIMGSDGEDDEKPVRLVKVDSFYIMKNEVTLRFFREAFKCWKSYGVEYKTTAETRGKLLYSYSKDNYIYKEGHYWNNLSYPQEDNYPVTGICWLDAIMFSNFVSIFEGFEPCYKYDDNGNIKCDFNADGYRLPTEAEWEFAARGGNKTNNYLFAGSDSFAEVAWTIENSDGMTHPIAQKKPNELGLYDLSGNVWEFCWDSKGAYDPLADDNPKGVELDEIKVRRGGSAIEIMDYCRITNRGSVLDLTSFLGSGLRLVRKAE